MFDPVSITPSLRVSYVSSSLCHVDVGILSLTIERFWSIQSIISFMSRNKAIYRYAVMDG